MQVNIGHFVAHKQELLTLLLPLTYCVGGEEHHVFVEVKLDRSHSDYDRLLQLLEEVEAELLNEAAVEAIANRVYELIDALPELAKDLEQQRQTVLLAHYRDCLD